MIYIQIGQKVKSDKKTNCSQSKFQFKVLAVLAIHISLAFPDKDFTNKRQDCSLLH